MFDRLKLLRHLRATGCGFGWHSHSCAAASLLVIGALGVAAATAQEPAPPGVDPVIFAAKRFPQPVRVGDLVHRTILEPVESRRILGHVEEVVRLDGGEQAIVMSFGGFFGIGSRPIAVPLHAMVLLGNELEVLDLTPKQLGELHTYSGNDHVLGPNEIIDIGLAHPSH